MTFVPLHHVRKGTRLSPSSSSASLLFIVVVRGGSLGTRLTDGGQVLHPPQLSHLSNRWTGLLWTLGLDIFSPTTYSLMKLTDLPVSLCDYIILETLACKFVWLYYTGNTAFSLYTWTQSKYLIRWWINPTAMVKVWLQVHTTVQWLLWYSVDNLSTCLVTVLSTTAADVCIPVNCFSGCACIKLVTVLCSNSSCAVTSHL